jgi:hypothetical protein
MRAGNPFRPTRWEHHSDGFPLIWFSPTARLLAEDKSAYLYGSRGSGKTTLLRSICWEDLVKNESLMLQKDLKDFQHIGIYIRFPDHVSGSMNFLNWVNLFPDTPNPDLEFFNFFSLAVELICLERLLATVHELRIHKHLELKSASEISYVQNLIDEFPKLKIFSDQPPKTFLDLSRLLRNLLRRMNEASGRGTIARIIDTLPSRDPNELLQWGTEHLSSILNFKNDSRKLRLGFKFCLDDCEVLSTLQRTSVNTLVRKSRFPVSWVISSVSVGSDAGSTFTSEQPLTDADRRVISLNSRQRTDFKELCESVASLRIYFALPNHARPAIEGRQIRQIFPLEERLGVRSVNEIIHVILRRSTNPEARVILEGAKRLQDILRASKDLQYRRISNNPDRLPFYEAYILMCWNSTSDAFSTQIGEDSFQKIDRSANRLSEPNFQAWMRRKMVAAMLHLASKLGFRRLSLAGENIVVTLADRSIRDFLEILAEIYDAFASAFSRGIDTDEERENTLRRFSRSRINTSIQSAGIYSSSEAFYQGITTQTDVNRDAVLRLIETLGRITSRLQTNPDDPTVLGRAERGVFIIDTRHPHLTNNANVVKDRDLVFQTLKQAELAGYLRAVPFNARSSNSSLFSSGAEQRLVAFRLHRRLAPHFRFSYRGAYEPVQVSAELLAEACKAMTASSFEASIQTLLQQTSGNDFQLLLPLDFEPDND